MAKKVKLDVNSIAELNNELYLLQKEKEITFAVKYDVAKVIEKTTQILKNYNEQRNKLIEQYGEEKTEGKKDFTLEKGTEKGDKGFKELEGLMAKEETISADFTFKDFKDLKSENAYIQLMKFLDKS